MGLITSIEEIASKATERKNPSAPGTQTQMYVPPEQIRKEAEDKAAEEKTKTTAADPKTNEPSKISDEKALQSGTTNAYLITSITEMVRGGILLYKQANCLSDREKDILELANAKNEKDLTEVERSVIFKYSKACAKYDKKKEKIRTSEEDMEMLTEGLTTYSKVTGKETSPTLMLAAVLAKYASSIAMDSLLD